MAHPSPTLAPHERRKLERNIHLFYAFRLLREAQIWIPIWIVYLVVDRGFTLSEVGVAEAAFLIGLTILEVPTGAVADRYGRSKSLVLGAITLIAALLIFAFATSIPILLASFLLWSVADTLMSGADLALLYDSLSALGRQREYEKLAGRGEAMLWGGATLAVLIGAPLAAQVSTQFTIFIGAATMAIAATVALRMVEAPRHPQSVPATSYLVGARHAIRTAWNLPAVRTAIVFTAAIGAGLGATGFLVQPFLLDKGQDVDIVFSALQLPGLLAAVVGSLLAFRLVSRAGPIAVLTALPVLGVGAYAALALIDDLGAVGFLALLMMLQSMVQPIATGYINRRVPSDQRATILSLQTLMLGLILAPFSASVGFIFDDLGLQWAFAIPGIALAALALGAGGLWVAAHQREQLQAPQPAPASAAPSVVAPVVPPHPGDPG